MTWEQKLRYMAQQYQAGYGVRGGDGEHYLTATVRELDTLRAEVEALRADLARERDRIADALRLLDDYRERGAPMPTYAELIRVLQGTT